MKQLWLAGLGAALLAACGPAPQSPPPAATQPASTPAPAGGQAPAQQPPAGGQGPNFLELMGGARNAAYKVTYRMSGTGGAGAAIEQTWYIKPPKSRWDIGNDMSIFVLEDGVYQCTRAGATSTCLQLTQGLGGFQNPGFQAQMDLQDKPDQFNPNYQGTRQIAGQQAQCYALSPVGAALSLGQGTFCFSSQGVPLLMETRSPGGEFRMEATSYSTSVSDGDFTLPARPTQLPAIPGLPGGLPQVPGLPGGQVPQIPQIPGR